MLEQIAALGADDLTVDVGTGDGAYVFRRAKAEPRRLHLGLDSNADGLAEISRKAARRAERGGAPNALFVHAPAESLPEALTGLAAEVTVILPWGSLLRAMARPDIPTLAAIRRLCAPNARLMVVLGYDARSDPGAAAELPVLDDSHVPNLVLGYREAGFAMKVAPAGVDEVRQLGTSWAGRLAFGKPRPFFRIMGRAT